MQNINSSFCCAILYLRFVLPFYFIFCCFLFVQTYVNCLIFLVKLISLVCYTLFYFKFLFHMLFLSIFVQAICWIISYIITFCFVQLICYLFRFVGLQIYLNCDVFFLYFIMFCFLYHMCWFLLCSIDLLFCCDVS